MLIVTNLKNNATDLEKLIFSYLQHNFKSGNIEEEIKEVSRIDNYLHKMKEDIEALVSLYDNKLASLKAEAKNG